MEKKIILTGTECEEYCLLNEKFDNAVNKLVKIRIGEIKFVVTFLISFGCLLTGLIMGFVIGTS